ncbi:uncharacterized protein LOC123398687 isoform X1 [Hordeum vulgare subsp. vulgare]|uniref:uncharacterized protein LOC123398687 isoform X1 n=1 Tax=Hordeum vulgare subsp. vulgare TaxID=112509 RepID=UPI001D1A47DD|nr:uncharacterized protein LOC123398687 isoform X1 [Hordeum vulgare subsp. vulgare]
MTPGFGPGPQGSCDGVVRGPGLLLVKGGIACARRRRSKRRSRGSGVPSFAPGSSTFQCGTGAAATTDAKKLQQSHAHSCFTDYVLWSVLVIENCPRAPFLVSLVITVGTQYVTICFLI